MERNRAWRGTPGDRCRPRWPPPRSSPGASCGPGRRSSRDRAVDQRALGLYRHVGRDHVECRLLHVLAPGDLEAEFQTSVAHIPPQVEVERARHVAHVDRDPNLELLGYLDLTL